MAYRQHDSLTSCLQNAKLPPVEWVLKTCWFSIVDDEVNRQLYLALSLTVVGSLGEPTADELLILTAPA
jgi:hypothetical protein